MIWGDIWGNLGPLRIDWSDEKLFIKIRLINPIEPKRDKKSL